MQGGRPEAIRDRASSRLFLKSTRPLPHPTPTNDLVVRQLFSQESTDAPILQHLLNMCNMCPLPIMLGHFLQYPQLHGAPSFPRKASEQCLLR